MADPTPTPWHISGRHMRPSATPYGVLISSARGDGFEYSVSWCAPHPGIDRSTADANAAFIVKAVNSHDALKASLAEMVGIYWGEGDGHEPPPECIQRAMAALASIKETV